MVALCGHFDIVNSLIQAGSDVNKQGSHFRLAPLFFAVRGSKSSSIIDALLMYGAHCSQHYIIGCTY